MVDVGGDPAGAVVLAQYAGLLRNRPYNMWMVVNANRPQTARAENVLGYMDAIERAGRLKVTGLINNTHLLRDTALEDILRGDVLVQGSSGTARGCQWSAPWWKRGCGRRQRDWSWRESHFISLAMRPAWLDSTEGKEG